MRVDAPNRAAVVEVEVEVEEMRIEIRRIAIHRLRRSSVVEAVAAEMPTIEIRHKAIHRLRRSPMKAAHPSVLMRHHPRAGDANASFSRMNATNAKRAATHRASIAS